MRTSFVPQLLLVGIAVLSACESGYTPTQPGMTDAPQLASAAARAGGDGALVIRETVPGAVLMVDFDRELTLTVGHTAAQLADICATGVFPEEITELDVFRPNGVLHVLAQTGPLPAVVWPVLSLVDPCAELLGVTPLAEGTAHAVYTDNDFFLSGKGAGSFGLHAQGTLTELATGRLLHLNGKFRNVILPDGTVKLPVIDIVLHPIGR